MQRAISIFGALALLTATTTVAGAVGNITGTVTHVHPVSNIVKFNDGRTVYLDPGATFTVDGREVSIDQIKPGMRVNIAGGRVGDEGTVQSGAQPQGTAQPSQRAAQSGAMNVPAGHPPVDVSGKVARYDAQTNILTFEDGRMIKLGQQASVWQQGSMSAIAPGTQVFVRGGQPTGYRAAWDVSSMPLHRMGTVLNVDPASALIVMSDGTVVKVSPATKVQSDGQALRLTDLQPGDEVVLVGKPLAASAGTTTSTTDSSGMASPGARPGARTQAGSQAIRAGSLPAFYNATFDASEVHLVRKNQAP